MDKSSLPLVTSFIIRFVIENPECQPQLTTQVSAPFRGAIRHIQTDQEITFSRLGEAIEFMSRFIPLGSDT